MESICRLCCTPYEISQLKNLFAEKNRYLLEKLNYCACFTFHIDAEDGCPCCFCIRCTGLLLAAYEFKTLCESAETNFLAMVQSDIIDKVDDEYSTDELIELADDDLDYRLEHLEVSIDSPHATKADSTENVFDDTVAIDDEAQVTTTLRVENRKIHTKANSPTCDICSASFRRKGELRQHMKLVHNSTIPPKSFICESCGKDFKSRYTLRYHISGAHVDAVEKNYSCDLCDFKCRRARYLVSHALKHSGEKPHRCDECGLSFGFHGSLNRHIQSVHRNERRHKCTICGRQYQTKFRLREHSKSHTLENPHECPQCHKRYRYKNSLRRHLKKDHRSEVKNHLKDDRLAAETLRIDLSVR